MEEVKLVSDADALLSMRDSDFDAYSAYGEVIDNSIQAEAKKIKIHIQSHPQPIGKKTFKVVDWIAFADDGIGMDLDILHKCMQLGYSSRYNDRSGIGRFGVGMTLGAINQCKRVDIYSKIDRGEWLYTFIDIDEITSKPPKMASIPLPIKKEVPNEYINLIDPNRGTLMIWGKYDRQPDSADELIEEMDIWIGRTYRKFLWGDISVTKQLFPIDIELNNKKILPIDPLHLKNDRFPNDIKSSLFEPIYIPWAIPTDDQKTDKQGNQIEESKIKIVMSFVHESLRAHQGIGNSNETKMRFLDRNEGISILRNGREVFYGHIPYWKPAFEDRDRWWGCEISFDAILDKAFSVKNIKRGAVPISDLKAIIMGKIVPTIKKCREDVSAFWTNKKNEARQEELKNQESSGTATGHEEAEKIVKNDTQAVKITEDTKKQANELVEKLKKDETNQQKAAWAIKFASQPFTIIDEGWKSPEFIEIHPLAGTDVIKYNLSHPFIDELYAIVKKIRETPEQVSETLAIRLKSLIDLLIISYAKAENGFDSEKQFKAKDLFEDLRMNWGQFLKTYLRVWKEENENDI